jgi:hypothetical protein
VAIRQPTKFWLLLIATIVIDVAVTAWLFNSQQQASSTDSLDDPALKYALPVWGALAFGQLSVLAIWSVFRLRYDWWSWAFPAAALFGVSAVRNYLQIWGSDWATIDYASRSALQMLIPVVVLWMLVRVPWWQRITRDPLRRKWEFSLLQILAWTTAVAVLSTIFVRSSRLDGGMPMALGASFGIVVPAALAICVAAVSQLRIHWLLRVVGYLMAGLCAGIFMLEFSTGMQLTVTQFMSGKAPWAWLAGRRLILEFTLEALLIAAWLEWGGFVARGETQLAEAA